MPSTTQQLVILLLFVLPGTVYQAVLDQLRGPLASEHEPGNRALRALAASAVLDSVYAVIAGPPLLDLFSPSGRGIMAGLTARPREAGFVALTLLVLVPAALAYTEFAIRHRRAVARFDSTPTAWDHLFRQCGSSYVRVRARDGTWIGGWYGSKSFASGHPQPQDLFLQAEYQMNTDGTFGERLAGTAGVYIPATDITHLEILESVAPSGS